MSNRKQNIGYRISELRREMALSQRELGRLIGMSPNTVSAYEGGKMKPRYETLCKLATVLGTTPQAIDPSGPWESAAGVHDIMESISTYSVSRVDVRAVPMLGCAAAAGYRPAVEPLDEFLVGYSDETAVFGGVPAGSSWFALNIEGDSMSPEYPDGTRLLVAGGEFPRRGDIVAARLADHAEVLIKRYDRRNGTVVLEALNPAGQSYTIDLASEAGRIVWMWPVVRADIDLRKQRLERKRNGTR